MCKFFFSSPHTSHRSYIVPKNLDTVPTPFETMLCAWLGLIAGALDVVGHKNSEIES